MATVTLRSSLLLDSDTDSLVESVVDSVNDSVIGSVNDLVDYCNRLRYPAKHYLVSPVYHLDSLTDSLTDTVNYPFLARTFSCIYRHSRARFTIKLLGQFHTLQKLTQAVGWREIGTLGKVHNLIVHI